MSVPSTIGSFSVPPITPRRAVAVKLVRWLLDDLVGPLESEDNVPMRDWAVLAFFCLVPLFYMTSVVFEAVKPRLAR